MTTPVSISFFPFLFVIVAICFSFLFLRYHSCIIQHCHSKSNVLCIVSEGEALLKLKNDLIDPSNKLSSWVEGGDCCHVNQLHLAAAPLSAPDFDAPPAEWEAYERSKLRGKINPSLLELKHLNSLDLSNKNFTSILLRGSIPKFFGLLESLTYLNLSRAQFQGEIPHNRGNLSKLQYLDLRSNNWWDIEATTTYWLQVTFKHPSLLDLHLSACSLEDDPSPIGVNSTKSLVVLDLSENNFSSVPMSTFGLHGLVSIDLSGNSLEGSIPDYFRNISFLEVHDLSGNSLNSSTPNSLFGLNHLQFLNLSGNEIYQDISEILLSLSRCCLDCLESLDMAHNHLFGHLIDQLGHFKNLAHLSLAGNNISSSIPSSIGELSSLNFFDVSENQLNGTFPGCFGQLESLETQNLGCNLLEGVVSETHFFNLTRLKTLASSQNRLRFEPNSSWIPLWLKFQKNLSVLDISDAGTSDILPTWLLNLSSQFQYVNISYVVDLSSNRFTGPLPRLFPTLQFLILSNNSFSSPLFELVCNSLRTEPIRILAIETNLLSGEIPDCWNCWRELPSTLQHSTRLITLDLSDNHFNGSVPAWIGDKLSKLEILILRLNTLDGHIPQKICQLQSLQILDLGHNNISGAIPNVLVIIVQWLTKATKIAICFSGQDENSSTLGLVTSICLSTNRLIGEIPKELGSVVELQNQLNCEIPSSFSNLNFLNHFNVSYNNLTGQIPTSTHLQSFENFSYMGNHICGTPLIKNCTSKGIPTDVAKNGSSSEGSKVNWLYASIVLGFVIGFWGVLAPLFFIRSWRYAYYRKLDHVG
ncbi:hypothetical protein ES332_A11G336500v1 [Gossypium tomentosum]|uniref:Leucine-rich repeat-containing N-terminal plant-type domain-containing protein n=1 Tax=Gossypium tomentosum TaxID=34277 RepID=A0A5D2NH02_GOSTO|nr:hypothetical protein ES332_A11G336500v1 [Gossypium tomentosum]